MTRRSIEFEVLSNSAAATGVVLRSLRHGILRADSVDEIVDGVRHGSLTLVLAPSVAQSLDALFAERLRVIRAWRRDGQTGARTSREWRITGIEDGHDDAGTLTPMTITAESMLLDLGERGLVQEMTTSGWPRYAGAAPMQTAQQILETRLFANLPPSLQHFSLGTVESTRLLDSVSWEWATPLELAQLVAKAAELELDCVPLNADGTGGYVLHFVRQINGSLSPARATQRGALRSVSRQRRTEELASAVLMTGAPENNPAGVALLATAAWRGGNVAPDGWLELTDAAAGDGPVQALDQFVGDFLQAVDGSRTEILATFDATDAISVVQVDDAWLDAHVAEGDMLQLRADAAGTRLSVLVDPYLTEDQLLGSGYVEKRIPREELRGTWNLVPNPKGAEYTSETAPPVGYTFTGQPVDPALQSTAERVDDAPPGSELGDGECWRILFRTAGASLRLPDVPALEPAKGEAKLCASLLLYIDANYLTESYTIPSLYGNRVGQTPSIRLTVRNASVTATAKTWNGQIWFRFDLTGLDVVNLARHGLTLKAEDGFFSEPAAPGGNPVTYQDTVAARGGIPVYLRFAQLTTDQVGEAQAWVEHAAACALHQAGNRELRARRGGSLSLDGSIIDASRLVGPRGSRATQWARELLPGRRLAIESTPLNMIETVRLTRIARNELRAAVPELSIADPRDTLTRRVRDASPV